MAGLAHSTINIISVVVNEQIASRITPRSTDLVIALASGAAGAFAISRDDIADSLPGVAISISLVPPLCVGGICLSIGEWPAAWGAVLLFITNFLSILLAGGGVFLLLGLHKVTGQSKGLRARRHAFPTVIIGVILVSIPLLGSSSKIAQKSVTEFRTIEATLDWLENSGYQMVSVKTFRRGVRITIGGEGPLPDTDALAAELRSTLRRPMVVDLKIVPVRAVTIRIKSPDS